MKYARTAVGIATVALVVVIAYFNPIGFFCLCMIPVLCSVVS